jgi:phosphatidylglycerol:prolipoprotein diacylglycerol transferase
MYPFLLPEIFGYTIPMYDLLIVLGCLAMLIYIAHRMEKQEGFTREQTNKVLVLVVGSLLFALFSSWLFDGIFHSIKNGELTFGSITFLGGLIGGVTFFLLMIKFFYKDLAIHLRKLMNVILTGVILAHGFGRVGCFCAGCCYGVPTASCLGVKFRYGQSVQEYDTGVFPTQLFEAIFLFTLFILLTKVKRFKRFQIEVYLITYGVFRFFLEFIRGDDRGVVLPLIVTQYNVYPSPSQLMSLALIGVGVYYIYKHRKEATVTV